MFFYVMSQLKLMKTIMQTNRMQCVSYPSTILVHTHKHSTGDPVYWICLSGSIHLDVTEIQMQLMLRNKQKKSWSQLLIDQAHKTKHNEKSYTLYKVNTTRNYYPIDPNSQLNRVSRKINSTFSFQYYEQRDSVGSTNE